MSCKVTNRISGSREQPARAVRNWLVPRLDDERSEDPAEHYSSIPITQLVPILDASKAKPERDVRERSSNNDARQPFQFTHRFHPAVLPDRKIRGGLQQSRKA